MTTAGGISGLSDYLDKEIHSIRVFLVSKTQPNFVYIYALFIAKRKNRKKKKEKKKRGNEKEGR